MFGFKKSDDKKVIDKKTGEELFVCPRCKINMQKLRKNDVVIDVCKKCKGMWVDAGELEKLADVKVRRSKK